MRRPDVFTLDYSHPLAQGLVFAPFSLWKDDAPRGGPVSLVNGPTYTDLCGRGAYNLRRTSGDHISAEHRPDFVLGDVFTVHSVVRQSSISTDGDASSIRAILNKELSFSNRAFWLAQWQSKYFFRVGNTTFNLASTTLAQIGVKKTITVVRDYPSVKMYVDGVLEASISVEISTANVVSPLLVGKQYGYTDRSFDGAIADPCVYNRALSPAEIALLADRTDPMLGGLIVEERPVLWFDMGGSTEFESPAVITAEASIAASGSKQATSPATVTASASLGMGGSKQAVAPLNIVGSISAEASGIKTIAGLDKEGPAVVTAAATLGMGGVKGGVGAAALGADSAVEAGGMKGAAGQAWIDAMGEFYASRGPDDLPITADEIGRMVSLQASNYSAVLAKRNYTARLS